MDKNGLTQTKTNQKPAPKNTDMHASKQIVPC